MSVNAAAEKLADKLSESDFIRVFSHHDADGIAAAAIMCRALYRAGKKFHLSIVDRMSPEMIKKGEPTLLCDIGSSMQDLAEDVMVIDHHMPEFTGEYHVNPHLCGIDGDTELSGAGAAYLAASYLGDNRDLCGLVLLGILGDGQKIEGLNKEIVTGGIADQIIVPERGIPLCGRNLREQFLYASNPYLRGISGEDEVVDAMIENAGTVQSPENPLKTQPDYTKLLSEAVFKTAPFTNADAMTALWGDKYNLTRGAVHDAHSMCGVADACGLTGNGALGVRLCMGDASAADAAWEITLKYRMDVIDAIKSMKRLDEKTALFEVNNPLARSPAADSLCGAGLYNEPVFVISREAGICRLSARCPKDSEIVLSEIMEEIAAKTGGSGGGHRLRAGAVFSDSKTDILRNELAGILADAGAE